MAQRQITSAAFTGFEVHPSTPKETKTKPKQARQSSAISGPSLKLNDEKPEAMRQ